MKNHHFHCIYYAGYALKDVSVYYIMKTNPSVFDKLERKWDGDENSYCHVSDLPILLMLFLTFPVLENKTERCYKKIPHGTH